MYYFVRLIETNAKCRYIQATREKSGGRGGACDTPLALFISRLQRQNGPNKVGGQQLRCDLEPSSMCVQRANIFHNPSIIMADPQPPGIVEGATTGDVEDEVQPTAKSAEDRKAAAALSSLDAPQEESATTKDIDHAAIQKAMDRLAGSGKTNGAVTNKAEEKKEVKKPVVKVAVADVTLLVCSSKNTLFQLEGGDVRSWRESPICPISLGYVFQFGRVFPSRCDGMR